VPIETNFNEIHLNSLRAEHPLQNAPWDRKDCFVIIGHEIASFNKYFSFLFIVWSYSDMKPAYNICDKFCNWRSYKTRDGIV